MNVIAFYDITKKTVEDMAKHHGVDDLDKYYQPTDLSMECINRYGGIQQVFAQMAFHAQNATLISNIVRFENNIDFLDKVTHSFNPTEFLAEINNMELEAKIDHYLEKLRYNEGKKEGLIWNSEKSKPENKDKIAKRYAATLIDCANYLVNFDSKEEVHNDLKSYYQDHDCKSVIQYFRGKIKNGFSIALTCDFLKEFDDEFDDLAKPDVHIKDTLISLLKKPDKYYDSENRQYECIEVLRRIVKEVNNDNANEKLTVYKLDKMIWLICSDNFYLDDINQPKRKYLDKISDL